MKKLLIPAIIILYTLFVFKVGREYEFNSQNQHYEAACFYADIVHQMLDDPEMGQKAHFLYDNWKSGMDTAFRFKNFRQINLDDYYWGY